MVDCQTVDCQMVVWPWCETGTLGSLGTLPGVLADGTEVTVVSGAEAGPLVGVDGTEAESEGTEAWEPELEGP